MEPIFMDRRDGGRHLAHALERHPFRGTPIVLALPRGGLPVAYEVAHALGAPLDIFTVRKLGLPGQHELAMGAIASGGVRVLNDDLVQRLRISDKVIAAVTLAEEKELVRRESVYRGDTPRIPVENRCVVLVDDGLATGSTMRAAVAAIKRMKPSYIIVAVPIGAPDTCKALAKEVDEVVCARTPEPFFSVGFWYGDFSQVSDREVHHLLDESRSWSTC